MTHELIFEYPSFISQARSPSPIISFDLILCLLFFVSIFSFWLSPGGLAWTLTRLVPMKGQNSKQKLPIIPGPSGWPIIGMFMAFNGSLTHRVLAKISNSLRAKSLMAFSIGFTRFIISSHPETAKDILNSSSFADRPVKESAYELLFHRAMGFAPYGEYWRNLRRISATHLFSPKRIASFGGFRRDIGFKMVDRIKVLMGRDGFIEVRKVLHFGSLNNVMMSVFGKSYEFEGENSDGLELESLVSEGYELLGLFNWSDHFPLLGWLDLQGVKRSCRNLVAKVNIFVGKIIDDHKEKRATKPIIKVDGDDNYEDHCGDFVDVLLDLEQENKLSDNDMIAVLWEMIFRGTDTVAILIEWILARMVLHQDIQAKAQSEIDMVVGINRSPTDSDLQNLPYLQAIVKETLRMHPPGPLLSWARLSIHDAQIGPHFIPAGTTAMVNMWAITHDPEVWTESDKFKPERFLQAEDVAIMGSDLRLAPFGSGRRVCPGKALGMATVELWLALLLQNFKWVNSEDRGVDLSESLKLSLEMKNSLVCKAIPRVHG